MISIFYNEKMFILYSVVILILSKVSYAGNLYPRDSETRDSKLLDGIWNFRTADLFDQDRGFREKWYESPLSQTGEVIPMPVPSSYNDITQNKSIRDFIGWVWYDKIFFVPSYWKLDLQRIVIRFGGAHYNARIFLNGKSIVNHTGGHLPFCADITKNLRRGQNLLTVALNNTLTPSTVPQGNIVYETDNLRYPPGYHVQNVNFDFFNYAGIHRSVVIYSTPIVYIDDITIATDINNSNGLIKYIIYVSNNTTEAICQIKVYDKNNKFVASAQNCQGTITVKNVNLWWPYTMSSNPGYLYTMKIHLTVKNITDVYYQPVGIRTVKVTNTSFLINNIPFRFMGFGKHEDANIRGKGLDLPLIIKDYNLIKWIGANSFRTSHYPYSEEMMDQADIQGVVVINECPAVGLNRFNSELLKIHLTEITELIQRDKNRPSVVMWSVANEPTSGVLAAEDYFRKIVQKTKILDPTRPVTAAINADCNSDKIGQFMDVIMVNRYFGWYSDIGHTEVIVKQLLYDFTNFHKKYLKPVMISEYGADTIPGLHMDPSFIFTEDYQTEFIVQYHKGFDLLYKKGFFIGELIWNFADFLTEQSLTRVVGNKKGIFTRERQPKAAAKILRCRYHHLSNKSIAEDVYCPAIYVNKC